MFRQSLLAAPALAMATSCVPQSAPPKAALAPARAETRPAALLRKLALDVPDGLPIVAPRLVASGIVAQVLPPRILPAAAPPFLAATRSPDDAARAVQCLTEAVYYEARSEAEDGQRAVAQVVLNRVRDRAFPGSVCGVVYQGATRRTGCQFSFTCDGSMNGRREPSAWERARAVAGAALAGSVYAPVGSATFYHANYVLPWWAGSMARIGSVGAHIFYRWRGAMENALAFRQAYVGVEPGPVTASAITIAAAGGIGAEQEVVAGVTIHRGASRGAAASASASASVVAALTSPPAPAARRTLLVSGVHVHFGARSPRHIVVSADGAPSGAIAAVAEERDPI